ncbi:hypothetical protein L3X38_043860 [Prunus dulcis]|uniref:Uncharacterized protein n=1 Tax=Prunus dulcis TaxID=3755 RepID=A0AAD4UXL8_PRUDU|nr:hypothetical protein L3X38_043860 [Prunus dulcis]
MVPAEDSPMPKLVAKSSSNDNVKAQVKFWREFRGYLLESTKCADWSLGIVCRRLVWVSVCRHFTDLITYESVEYANSPFSVAHRAGLCFVFIPRVVT